MWTTRAITRLFFRYRPPYNSCHICSKVFEHNVSQRIKNIGLDLSTLAKQKCLRSIQWKNKYIDNVILNPHIYWLLMSWRHAYSSVLFPTLIEKLYLYRSQYWDKVNLNIELIHILVLITKQVLKWAFLFYKKKKSDFSTHINLYSF